MGILRRDLRTKGIRRRIRGREAGAGDDGEGSEAEGRIRSAASERPRFRRKPIRAVEFLLQALALLGFAPRLVPGGQSVVAGWDPSREWREAVAQARAARAPCHGLMRPRAGRPSTGGPRNLSSAWRAPA